MTESLIKRIPAQSLYVSEPDPRWFGNDANPEPRPGHWTNGNWLKSRFHFNFAESHSGANNFGCLRVCNDDLVQPTRGFGSHPHREMEIATFVLKGGLSHKDSMGNEETLGRGSVQFMSAGTGVVHSEKNKSPAEPLRFLQIWITPDKRGVEPNYGSLVGTDETAARRLNQFHHIVAPWDSKKTDSPVRLHQDVNFYFAEIEPGKQVPLVLPENRMAYAILAEGQVKVDAKSESHGTQQVQLDEGDGCQLFSKGSDNDLLVSTSSKEPALILVIEMKENLNDVH